MKPITFHPNVQRDISDALEGYSGISKKLEDEIWEEFQRALLAIQKTPSQHKDSYTGLNRYNLVQFPYNILFKEYEDRIRIQVFRHNKRRETYGSYRKLS